MEGGRVDGETYGELMRCRPFCSSFLHQVLQFQEGGEGDGAGGCGDVERGVGGEAEERAEFPGEGCGYFFPG